MATEEEILQLYINGRQSGEDNRLHAVIGNLEAKRSKELTDSLGELNRSINNNISNLIINVDHNAGRLIRSVDGSMNDLSNSIEKQIDNLIESNERLSRSNESYAESMKKLTFWLVLITAIGVIVSWLK